MQFDSYKVSGSKYNSFYLVMWRRSRRLRRAGCERCTGLGYYGVSRLLDCKPCIFIL